MTQKQILEQVKNHIRQQGYQLAPELAENYYLSLQARPFMLIAGYTGTDLTLLPRLFAQAVGATKENGRYLQLTVRPDWMDSSDLFGHLNLEGCFVPGPLIDFLKAAQSEPDKPWFLCLDRLNLARAEYFLRELLGTVESPVGKEKPFVTMAYYGSDRAAAEKYGQIPWLGNVYITVTVNLDETSRPLNQRLLDRVHTLLLEKDDVMGTPVAMPGPVAADNGFLKTRYTELEQCDPEKLEIWIDRFARLNETLMQANAYVGFQLRNDALFYLMHNAGGDILPEDRAMDHMICRKVLTRVQGSQKAIGGVLSKLYEQCMAYPRAQERIARMQQLCDRDGFASAWD